MEKKIDAFIERWQLLIDERNERLGYQWKTTLSVMYGKKYARVVTEDHGQRSAAAFINLENGDILKTATWAAPAKKARGNVDSSVYGMEAIDNYGMVKYLR